MSKVASQFRQQVEFELSLLASQFEQWSKESMKQVKFPGESNSRQVEFVDEGNSPASKIRRRVEFARESRSPPSVRDLLFLDSSLHNWFVLLSRVVLGLLMDTR